MTDDLTPNENVQSETLTATVKSRIDSITDAGIVGQSVGDLRENFGSILNISSDANASVRNGTSGEFAPVGNDYIVEAGDEVKFAVALGEKG